MSEWWTYRPSDFLMFSARSWERLLEGAHADLWPLQAVLVVVALALLAGAWKRPAESLRWVLAVLALLWVGVAWSFHWSRFSTINTAAPWFAAAWGVQAALLLAWMAASAAAETARPLRLAGLGLAALALAGYPVLAPLAGRPWTQGELVGLTPDATALYTLGLLLALPLRHRGGLLVLPVLWLVVGWST
ncbi:MAG: hypothetical protein EOO24_61895, partial [Comamonadaceae bacterium]